MSRREHESEGLKSLASGTLSCEVWTVLQDYDDVNPFSKAHVKQLCLKTYALPRSNPTASGARLLAQDEAISWRDGGRGHRVKEPGR